MPPSIAPSAISAPHHRQAEPQCRPGHQYKVSKPQWQFSGTVKRLVPQRRGDLDAQAAHPDGHAQPCDDPQHPVDQPPHVWCLVSDAITTAFGQHAKYRRA
jgi:hypothetical protein